MRFFGLLTDYLVKRSMLKMPKPNTEVSYVDLTALDELTEHLAEAEEELRESEDRLSNAQRIAHMGSWDWNIVTNELFWSDEIYRIFGLSPQEFGATYDAFLNSVHPDDREFVQKHVDMAVHKDKKYNIDHRIMLSGGEVRYVHEQGEVTRDENDAPVRMLGTVIDITELKQVEKRLRRQAEELQLLNQAVEQMQDALVLVKDNLIYYVNASFVRMYGYSRDEIIGRPTIVLFAGSREEHEELGKRFRQVFREPNGLAKLEYRDRRKDGSVFWASTTAGIVDTHQGLFWVATIRDISFRKQAETYFQQKE